MDKISFIIPNNNYKKENNEENKQEINLNEVILKESGKASKLISKDLLDNNLVYKKIAPNLYRFNSIYGNSKSDINVLYNNACELKKTDIYSAIKLFNSCKDLINSDTNNKIKYEIYINLSLLLSEINGSYEEISNYYSEAIKVFGDRAEPYYYWALFCNKQKKYEKSYELFKIALSLKYEDALKKYPDTQYTSYGKFLFDEMSVTCYWLKKYDKAKILLEAIINDKDFLENKERLEKNLEFTNKEIQQMKK